jgi:hypothetical protein
VQVGWGSEFTLCATEEREGRLAAIQAFGNPTVTSVSPIKLTEN